MILIADSGSTKTHWCLVTEGGLQQVTTQGLNPHFVGEELLLSAFGKVREELSGDSTFSGRIYFYGAGCGTEEMKQLVARCLWSVFARAESCEVEGDLLGACRALCGRAAGLVGILGTGSNLCYYDGRGIARQRVSTGYILGDEGSGNHIGKRLLKDYLEGRMPSNISSMFHEDYDLSTHQFLDKLYHQPNPNRFLASLASFAARHQADPYVSTILRDCFSSFFDQLDYFSDYRNIPLNLVGGIVRTFLPAIQQAAKDHHVTLGVLQPDPMQGLVQYHSAHTD